MGLVAFADNDNGDLDMAAQKICPEVGLAHFFSPEPLDCELNQACGLGESDGVLTWYVAKREHQGIHTTLIAMLRLHMYCQVTFC